MVDEYKIRDYLDKAGIWALGFSTIFPSQTYLLARAQVKPHILIACYIQKGKDGQTAGQIGWYPGENVLPTTDPEYFAWVLRQELIHAKEWAERDGQFYPELRLTLCSPDVTSPGESQDPVDFLNWCLDPTWRKAILEQAGDFPQLSSLNKFS